MTTHQAHNIPWSLLVDNIALRNKPWTGSTEYDFYPAERPGEQNDLRHFARKLGSAVRTFAETERAKHPQRIVLEGGKIFPDALLDIPDIELTVEQQTLAFWRQEFGMSDARGPQAVKELLLHDAVPALLYLAQQKDVSMERFEWATYSNFFHYGARRIFEDSLAAYIVLNVHIAVGRFGEAFRGTPSFVRAREYLTLGTDYDLHERLQCEFFRDNQELQNVERLTPYLKRLFRLMYLWDMVTIEYSKPVDWEERVSDCLQFLWRFTPLEPVAAEA
ncbi:hypothetical protein AURDEDRAFT_116235 [Auricularia subglabra TFB-10046 SS5]|nr:hypothetical protein AURDEDRAFT_116235 [Auricularia subglabra TFB-10046 SS5]